MDGDFPFAFLIVYFSFCIFYGDHTHAITITGIARLAPGPVPAVSSSPRDSMITARSFKDGQKAPAAKRGIDHPVLTIRPGAGSASDRGNGICHPHAGIQNFFNGRVEPWFPRRNSYEAGPHIFLNSLPLFLYLFLSLCNLFFAVNCQP